MRRTVLVAVIGSTLVAMGVLAVCLLVDGEPIRAQVSVDNAARDVDAPAQPITLTVPTDPLRASSAMGERLILQLLGLVPAPPPAAVG